jgi:hypothetical protein
MPSLNVLFWNVGKKDLTEQIVNLARSKEVDILVLAENETEDEVLVQALNDQSETVFFVNRSLLCEKIVIFSRFAPEYVTPVRENNRLTIRRFQPPGYPEILLAAVHLMDKRSADSTTQREEARRTAIILKDTEREYQNERLLLMGDFNMNPFEEGMIMAGGFHGSMSSQVAQRKSRTIQNDVYGYFYNPCWGLLGDLRSEISGTYYYNSGGHICYEWNVFDQVLLRPSLIENFVKDRLEIIDSDGVNSLVTEIKRPHRDVYSDHLPLFFTLRF